MFPYLGSWALPLSLADRVWGRLAEDEAGR